MPAKVKRDQAVHMYQALAEGTPNRKRVALTIVGDVLDEAGFEASNASKIPHPVGTIARKVIETIAPPKDGG